VYLQLPGYLGSAHSLHNKELEYLIAPLISCALPLGIVPAPAGCSGMGLACGCGCVPLASIHSEIPTFTNQ
jgi:hypothetical protein